MNNQITEDYCSFEVSKLLKEKGYAIPTDKWWIEQLPHTVKTHYTKFDDFDVEGHPPMILSAIHHTGSENVHHAPAIHHALAIKWIRENFGIYIQFHVDDTITAAKEWSYSIYQLYWGEDKEIHCLKHRTGGFVNVELLTEAALLYTLNHLI